MTLRPLQLREWKALYRFTKIVLFLCGAFLIAYGFWIIVSGLFLSTYSSGYWFGIFPLYVGSMMVLFGIALKLEWFTDARRFW